MSGGAKILEGLRHAAEGNMTRVHINGQTWVRHDAESPEGRLNQARDKIADLTQEVDVLKSALRSIKDICAGDRLPRWKEDMLTVTHTRGRIMDICEIADMEPSGGA